MYWFMGVALSGRGCDKRMHNWCQTWESCPHTSNGHFHGLMRVKVLRTSLDCRVLLAGKSQSGHNGNSHGERESKAVLSFTVIVSIYNLWNNWEGKKLQSAQPQIAEQSTGKNENVSHMQNTVAWQYMYTGGSNNYLRATQWWWQ